ncbi:PP2C family protein-serine/threonine phosphatase [Spongisporangium articulatum]|uniref:PP2C family protein-serine/threonine phosphatase n=1 Tax=Spongisporangium articulatum TaxID=3362603 RepID=A0ABW8APC1_9ACTN
MTWGSATATGKRRQNQDSLLARFPVFVVADGMGGHSGGEVASELAVGVFRALAVRGELAPEDVTTAVETANEQIVAAAKRDQLLAGMGTTLVGLVLVHDDDEPYWLAVNIGDSRLYRFREGRLSQVTVDHSYVQELVEAGRIGPVEARTHADRNVVTRILGMHGRHRADYWVFPPEPGERFLLCSDGLYAELMDETIETVLGRFSDPEKAADELVRLALRSGGNDNVSVIVVDAGKDGSGT